jgi:hypothetical protein
MMETATQRQQRQRRSEWAEARKLRLVPRSRVCAHVLRKKACPSNTRYYECTGIDSKATDHWIVWQRPDGTRFGLAHVYATADEALRNGRAWASSRGLVAISDPEDSWYGYGTVPIRYELAVEKGE